MLRDSFVRRVLAVALAAMAVSLVWQSVPLWQARLLSGQSEPRQVAARGDLAADERATIALFEAARGSVVFISTAGRVRDPWTRSTVEVPRGTGSGFLWDDLGHVVTNWHVLEGASQAMVRLADGRSFSARLVGSAPANDLAVLRIPVAADRPPPLPIGRSGDLLVGQKVFAIGNPFGLDFTLTTGIVSALEREIPSERGGVIGGLIQTDAAINPGNSGGPLLDSAGRLIGVNTAIYSPSGGSAGIGFAVPVDRVNRIVPQLIAQGRYAPPRIGVRVDPRLQDQAARAGIDGVLVLGVEPGSPAERAGLRPARLRPDGRISPGDAIVGLGGRSVRTVEDLHDALATQDAGAEVVLQVLRDGRIVDIRLTLETGG